MKIPTLLVILVTFLFSGCASWKQADGEASFTSLMIYHQVLYLKGQIRKKIDAEEAYYRDTVDTLAESRADFDHTNMMRAVGAKAKAELKKIMNSKVVLAPLLIETLTENAKELVEAIEVGVEEERKQREKMEKSIQKLKRLNEKFTSLERTLVALSITPSKAEQTKRLGEFIVDAAKYYKELEEKNKKEK